MFFSDTVTDKYLNIKTKHILEAGRATDVYVVGSKSFRPDIQKPRQMESAVKDIQYHL